LIARWKARVEFLLSVIGLLILSLTVEATRQKVSRLAAIRRGQVSSSKVSGGRGRPWGIFFLVSTKLDTFCYPTVQTAPCYVPSF